MVEIWKPVCGFEQYYQVSNLGRIKSLDRIDSVGRLRKGQILNPSPKENGYMHISFCVDGKRKNANVHRIVAEAFISNPENKCDVNHIDGNKENNSVDNLEWTTRAENQKHAYNTGLQPKNKSRFIGFAKKNNANKKPVIMDSSIEFESINSAAEAIGSHLAGVQRALRTGGKCKGHTFKFAKY